MARVQLLDLPDELLGAIINQTSLASDTVKFGLVCKRLYQLAITSQAWRRHCLRTWAIWDPRHDLETKIAQKPLETDWHTLYFKRQQTDRRTSQLFESLLATQQARASRMHELATIGYDIKDQLMGICEDTPDEAEDVLARRWHAEAILDMMARRQAVEIWSRLQQGAHVELEDALGAYDIFVVGCTKEFIHSSLDALATAIRESTRGFNDMTIREKAVFVSQYLRSKNIVGLTNMEQYHALRNNFMSSALTVDYQDDDEKGCLPLQSVAIFCGVARRLGIQAQPSNFPGTVHAVITAPSDVSLDGIPRSEGDDTSREPELMHMDPFHQDGEVGPWQLLNRLSQTGVPAHLHAELLGPATEIEMVLRTGRNIMVSVEGQRMPGQDPPDEGAVQYPDGNTSKYAALWSTIISGDSDPTMTDARRRLALHHLLLMFHADFSQDVDMFAEIAQQFFDNMQELTLLIAHTLSAARAVKVPVSRPTAGTDPVRYRIGTSFVHGRYGYHGFIVGWSPTCAAPENWIVHMGIDELPRGRNQPFYNIV